MSPGQPWDTRKPRRMGLAWLPPEVQCFSPGLLWGLVSVLKNFTSPFTPRTTGGLTGGFTSFFSLGRSWQQGWGLWSRSVWWGALLVSLERAFVKEMRMWVGWWSSSVSGVFLGLSYLNGALAVVI